MYTTHLAIWRLLLGPLNLSHFVEDQNDPSTSQILPSWPSRAWRCWGKPRKSTRMTRTFHLPHAPGALVQSDRER